MVDLKNALRRKENCAELVISSDDDCFVFSQKFIVYAVTLPTVPLFSFSLLRHLMLVTLADLSDEERFL